MRLPIVVNYSCQTHLLSMMHLCAVVREARYSFVTVVLCSACDEQKLLLIKIKMKLIVVIALVMIKKVLMATRIIAMTTISRTN